MSAIVEMSDVRRVVGGPAAEAVAPPCARQSGRVEALDYVKGVGILLVVAGHVWRGMHSAGLRVDDRAFLFADRWIYSFHMALFFFVSGLFMVRSARKPPGRFLSDKAATLLYPYILWSLIQGAVSIALAGATTTRMTWGQLLHGLVVNPIGQFWFLYVLGMAALAVLGLTKLRVPPVGIMVVAIALYAVGRMGWLPYADVPARWGWSVLTPLFQFSMYFMYVALGACVGAVVPRAVRMVPTWVCAAVAITGAAVITAVVAADPTHDHLFDPVTALSGTAMVLAVGCLLERWRVRAFWFMGVLSLQIFVAHQIAASGARIVLQKGMHVGSVPAHLVMGVAAGILFPVALWWVAERFGVPGVFFGPWQRSGRPEPRPAGTALVGPAALVAKPAAH